MHEMEYSYLYLHFADMKKPIIKLISKIVQNSDSLLKVLLLDYKEEFDLIQYNFYHPNSNETEIAKSIHKDELDSNNLVPD